MKSPAGVKTLAASALATVLMLAPMSPATAVTAAPIDSSGPATASAGGFEFSLDRATGNKLVIDYQLGSESVDLQDTGPGVAVTYNGQSTTLPAEFTAQDGTTYSGDWNLNNGKLTFTTNSRSATLTPAAAPQGGIMVPRSAYTECATDYIAGGTIFGIAGGAPGVVSGFLLGGVAGTLICLDN